MKKKAVIVYGNGRRITIPEPESVRLEFKESLGKNFKFDIKADKKLVHSLFSGVRKKKK